MQAEQGVADGMSQVQTNRGAGAARGADQRRQIQGLSREILNTRQEDQRERGTLLLYALDDIFGSQGSLAGARLDLDQMLGCVQAVKSKLRHDGVAIRWKRRFLDEYAIAAAIGAKETHHHQMQINRQRIH